MDVRQLRYFVAVAEHKSFTQSAEALFMAQPPLSQQIRKLESDVGFKLFDRNSRKVELTAEGAFLLTATRRALTEFAHLERLALRLRDGEAGHLRIGFAFSALNWGLSQHLKDFRDRYGQVTLEVTQMPVPDQVAGLEKDAIDVGFTIGPVNIEHVVARKLDTEPLSAVLPVGHRLAGKPLIELAELAGEDFVGFTAPEGYDYISQACQAAGFVPKLNLQGAQVHTMIHMVAAGLGVTLAPACDCRMPVKGVVFAQVSAPTPTVAISAVWHRDRAHSLVDMLVAQITTGAPSSRPTPCPDPHRLARDNLE